MTDYSRRGQVLALSPGTRGRVLSIVTVVMSFIGVIAAVFIEGSRRPSPGDPLRLRWEFCFNLARMPFAA